MELDEEFQTDSQKTWMLGDIFHKTGIIDRDGNIYKANHCDPKIYKFCYGTEMAATELGFARLDVKMTAPQGMSCNVALFDFVKCSKIFCSLCSFLQLWHFKSEANYELQQNYAANDTSKKHDR